MMFWHLECAAIRRVVATEIKLREEHSRAGKQLSAQQADPDGWDIALCVCGRGTENQGQGGVSLAGRLRRGHTF